MNNLTGPFTDTNEWDLNPYIQWKLNPMPEENRLPIGTLVHNDTFNDTCIVLGYEYSFDNMPHSTSSLNFGKIPEKYEFHRVYFQKNQLFTHLEYDAKNDKYNTIILKP